jgi:hypothetical protein
MITRRTFLISGALAAWFGSSSWPRALIAATKPPVMLYKTPGCECCEGYADYLRQRGFSVTVKESENLAALSAKAGIPGELEGCHTAFIGSYVVDGHVPIEAVDKLLAERPTLKGLTLPGMPPGSPGMAGAKEGPFIIYGIDRDGKDSPYMTI